MAISTRDKGRGPARFSLRMAGRERTFGQTVHPLSLHETVDAHPVEGQYLHLVPRPDGCAFRDNGDPAELADAIWAREPIPSGGLSTTSGPSIGPGQAGPPGTNALGTFLISESTASASTAGCLVSRKPLILSKPGRTRVSQFTRAPVGALRGQTRVRGPACPAVPGHPQPRTPRRLRDPWRCARRGPPRFFRGGGGQCRSLPWRRRPW